jgi:hypothetical protein
MSKKFNFVICCQDCNKHEPKIIACFNSLAECITYLNKKGSKIVNGAFNILDYKDDESQEINGTELTIANVELFKYLYQKVGGHLMCPHRGEIHVCASKKNRDFSHIYDFLVEMYV